jgi:hypothetical protein
MKFFDPDKNDSTGLQKETRFKAQASRAAIQRPGIKTRLSIEK